MNKHIEATKALLALMQEALVELKPKQFWLSYSSYRFSIGFNGVDFSTLARIFGNENWVYKTPEKELRKELNEYIVIVLYGTSPIVDENEIQVKLSEMKMVG